MVYLMSDLDLPLRDRIYREPDGPHVAIVRGRDLDAALDHLDARPDCRALAVISLPKEVPDLELMNGRRLLVVDGDRAAMREFAEVGMKSGAEVEWLHAERPEYALDALLFLHAIGGTRHLDRHPDEVALLHQALVDQVLCPVPAEDDVVATHIGVEACFRVGRRLGILPRWRISILSWDLEIRARNTRIPGTTLGFRLSIVWLNAGASVGRTRKSSTPA